MNRGQLRREVRRKLNESSADLWTDDAINDWLNEAVRTMIVISQPLQTAFQFYPSLRDGSTGEYKSEYVLPLDVDEVYQVTAHNGSNFPLQLVDESVIADGTRVSGSPEYCYIKDSTTVTVEPLSVAPGLAIKALNSDDGQVSRKVLGLYPVPSTAESAITVFYFSKGCDMTNDNQIPHAIPLAFHRGLVHYATSLAKEIEEASAEADREMGKFQEYAKALKEKMIARGQQMEFPRVCESEDNGLPSGGSNFQVGWATED